MLRWWNIRKDDDNADDDKVRCRSPLKKGRISDWQATEGFVNTINSK